MRLRRSAIHRHSATVMAVALLVLAGALAGCSRRGADPVLSPARPEGLSPEAINPAFHVLLDARTVADLYVRNIERDAGRFDPSWNWDEGAGTWSRTTTGWSPITVGWSGGTTEVRREQTTAVTFRFTAGGFAVRSIADADRGALVLVLRQRHYATDPAYPLVDPYDVTLTMEAAFDVEDGEGRALRAIGTLAGGAERTLDGVVRTFGYEGSASWSIDYAGADDWCPAERLSADIHVIEGGLEADRYAGAFAAGAGVDRFTGALESARGAGVHSLDGSRGCAATP